MNINNNNPSKSSFIDLSKCISKPNSIFIVHQNMRSLRRNFDLLASNLEAFKDLPDLVFVSEIWIYSDEIEHYYLPGYKFHAIRNDTYPSGGVGVFVKAKFNCDVCSISMSSADTIKITVTLGNELFRFVCIYRLLSQPINDFLTEFAQYLTTEKIQNLILCGDYNLDTLQPSTYIENY